MKKRTEKIIMVIEIAVIIAILLTVLDVMLFVKNESIKNTGDSKAFNKKVGGLDNKYIVRYNYNLKVDEGYHKGLNGYYSIYKCTIIDPNKKKAYLTSEKIFLESGKAQYYLIEENDISQDNIDLIINEYNNSNEKLDTSPVSTIVIELNGIKVESDNIEMIKELNKDKDLIVRNYAGNDYAKFMYENDKANGSLKAR